MTDVRAPDALPGPLAELVGYHDRVRAHLARLDVLSRGSEGRDRDEWLDAIATLARSALDLVNDEGRLHNLDEERSIFPRLRDALTTADAELADALARAEADHEDLVPFWPPLEQWLGSLTVPDAVVSLPALRDARRSVEERYGPHLALEEIVIFPAAARLLDAPTWVVIAQEIRDRRLCPPPAGARVAP